MEIPGGCIESGEKPLQAAKRELEEETGYQSKSWKQIGVVDANPAIQSNKCYTFLAKNVKPVGKINFDPEEIIESKIVPLSSAYEYVRKGKITNTYIVAAFLWLAAEQGKI
ncbi:MAG: NUDIX hydrolase, partial [Promethearchaeota archaeon]